MTNRATALGLMSLVLALVPEAFGQGRCTLDDSIYQCWHRYNPDSFGSINTAEFSAQRAEIKGQTKKEITNELLSLVTSSSVVGGDTAATVSNFLPLLAFTGFGGNISGDNSTSSSGDKDLAVDLNLPFIGSGGENAIKLQAAFARERQVYGPLLNAIPEAERDAFENAFDSQSNIGDDVRISLAYSLTGRTFGRTLGPHRERLSQLYDAATNAISPSVNLNWIFEQMQKLADELKPGMKPPDPGRKMRDWPDMTLVPPDAVNKVPGVQDRLVALVEQAAQGTADLDTSLNKSLAMHRILDFRNLIDNQPQLILRVTARERDDLVGPDEQAAALTFEFPLGANLWGFSRKYGSSDCEGTWAKVNCLNRYREYIENQSQISKLAPRLSFSIDYSKIDDYDVSIPDPMVNFSQAGSTKLTASLGFGVRLNGEGANRDTRFDLAVKYENLSDDPTRNNRAIASATWTKQFRGLSIPITLVYANNPEFLDQQALGERLSANIGLKYEFRQYEQ